jgi:hypothetical protein
MSSGSDPGVGAPSPNVFHGVWERFDEPSFRRLKWTLTNTEAVIMMALLTSLIALAQSQSWEFIRYVIAHYNKSPRLPGDPTPDPLLDTSQGEAISDAVYYTFPKLWKRIRRAVSKGPTPPRLAEDEERSLKSPLFGIFAILNVAVFVIMGIAIPIWLTDGLLGTPIVKSKVTDECLNAKWLDAQSRYIGRQTKTDETFKLCADRLNAGCDSQYYFSTPQIQKTRPKTCPFSGNICHKNSTPFEITQYNISAYHIGVNSRSHVTMNHRLTCTPVSVENFIWFGSTPDGPRNFLSVQKRPQKIGEEQFLNQGLFMYLTTTNGPNSVSHESSGLYMALKNENPKLVVLPHRGPVNDLPREYSYSQDKFDESLRRDDGQPFLVILKAGAQMYASESDDPFFSAHNTRPNGRLGTSAYADYEATALGCVEQFQFCVPQMQLPKYCSPWGAREQSIWDPLQYLGKDSLNGDWNHWMEVLEAWDDQSGVSANEMLSTFLLLPRSVAVFDYVTSRISIFGIVPLIGLYGLNPIQVQRPIDTREQWVLEVETWFMKSLLGGIFRVQDASFWTFQDFDSKFSEKYVRDWSLCGRVLLRDGDHTNINWIGFWVTTAALTLICLVGNRIEQVFTTLKDGLPVPKWLVQLKVQMKLDFRTLLVSVSRQTELWNNPPFVWGVRMRPWYGSWNSNTRANPMELDELEVDNTLPETTLGNPIENQEEII